MWRHIIGNRLLLLFFFLMTRSLTKAGPLDPPLGSKSQIHDPTRQIGTCNDLNLPDIVLNLKVKKTKLYNIRTIII